MKSVIVHAVLALIGLGWAYRVWTAEDTVDQEDQIVTVVECDAERVERLEFKGSDRETLLEVSEDNGERSYWVTTTRRPGRDDAETNAFAGGTGVDDYLKEVAPLRATRALGELDEETLDELDLDGTPAEINLRCAGRDHGFRIGGSAFGSGDRYVQSAADGKVYLVAQTFVRELESSEFRLMQRELNAFPLTDVETLHVRAFERDKRLLQRNRREPQRAEWVDEAEPDRRNELFGNWLDRLGRLRVQKYLAIGASPGSDLDGVGAEPTPVLDVEYFGEDAASLGKLELVRIDQGEDTHFYARTPATRAWVKVLKSIAQQVEDDVRPVVGLEPVVREEADPEPTASDHGLPVPAIEPLRDLMPLSPSPSPSAPRRRTPSDADQADR